jgi:hypothetical protein
LREVVHRQIASGPLHGGVSVGFPAERDVAAAQAARTARVSCGVAGDGVADRIRPRKPGILERAEAESPVQAAAAYSHTVRTAEPPRGDLSFVARLG